MTEDQLEYLMQNRERLGLVLLRHCRILAVKNYGWTMGQPLPQGRDPETVVDEVMGKYFDGDRQFATDVSIEIQLKMGIKSWLSSIYSRMDSKALGLEAADSEETGQLPPDLQAANLHDYKILLKMLNATPEVQKSEELQLLLMAVEDGADDPKSQSMATEIPVARIYELRKKLSIIIPRVMNEFNKGAMDPI